MQKAWDFTLSLLGDPSVLAAVLGAFVAFLCGYLLMIWQQRRQFKEAMKQTHRDKIEHSAELVTDFHRRLDAIVTEIFSNRGFVTVPPSPIYALRTRLEAYASDLVPLANKIEEQVNYLYKSIGAYRDDGSGQITATEINQKKAEVVKLCKELGDKLAEKQKKLRV